MWCYDECISAMGKLKNMPSHGGNLWNASPMLYQLSYAVKSVRVTRYSIQTDRELGKHCATNVGHCKQIVASELISAMLEEQICIIRI